MTHCRTGWLAPLFGALLAGLAGLLLLGTWRAAGRPAYLAAWAGFCGCTALAFLLHALRGWLPEPLLTFGATPVYALGWGLFWAGGRRLRGADPAWPWVLLPPALSLGITLSILAAGVAVSLWKTRDYPATVSPN